MSSFNTDKKRYESVLDRIGHPRPCLSAQHLFPSQVRYLHFWDSQCADARLEEEACMVRPFRIAAFDFVAPDLRDGGKTLFTYSPIPITLNRESVRLMVNPDLDLSAAIVEMWLSEQKILSSNPSQTAQRLSMLGKKQPMLLQINEDIQKRTESTLSYLFPNSPLTTSEHPFSQLNVGLA